MYIHGIILYAEQILSFIAYNGCIEGLEIDSLMKLQIRKNAGLRLNPFLTLSLAQLNIVAQRVVLIVLQLEFRSLTSS